MSTSMVSFPLSDWCKLCDLLSMSPESTIKDVLQKIERLLFRIDTMSKLLPIAESLALIEIDLTLKEIMGNEFVNLITSIRSTINKIQEDK